MSEFLYSKNEKLYMKLLLYLIRLTLDFMFMYIVHREYMNISMLSIGYKTGAYAFATEPSKIIISYIVTIWFVENVVGKIIDSDKPHELIILALLCISILPNCTLFAFSNVEWHFFLLFVLFWSWLLFIVAQFCKDESSIPRRVSKRKGLTTRTGRGIFWGIAAIFIMGSIVLSYLYHGRLYVNLSLEDTDVYAARVLARGAFGIITNYFRNNAMYVVVPLLTNIFLLKRKYICFCISIFTLILLFSVDSQKAVLMLAIVSLMASIVMKKKISKLIVLSILGVNIIVILLYLFNNNMIFVDYLVKRIYFLPAILGRCHYVYVNENGYVFPMSSILQKIGIITNYEYNELPLPYALGKVFFGSSSISANTGGFGGAYAYGWVGLLVIPIVYAYLFRALNKVTANIEAKYYISFIVVMTYVITGATITSVIVVYGYLLGLLMFYIMAYTDIFRKVTIIRFIRRRTK